MGIRQLVLCGWVIAGLTSSAVASECQYPKLPASYPDGRVATKEEMIAGQATVKQFMTDADAYITCIDSENPVPPNADKLPDAEKKALMAREEIRIKKHNAVVGDEEKVRDAFNEQLRAWREAQKNK